MEESVTYAGMWPVPGRTMATPGVLALAQNAEQQEILGTALSDALGRYLLGDWGDMDSEDIESNNRAVQYGEERVFAAYNLPLWEGRTEKIWIITEADRSVTTLLLPAEY